MFRDQFESNLSLQVAESLYFPITIYAVMDEKPQFSSIENCTNFTATQLLSLNLSISITGGLCFLISSSIILLLFFNKAYSSLLQRLFLYLMLATALRHLSLFSLIEHYFYYAGQEEVCILVTYFNRWMVAMTLFFTIGMLLYLLYMVSHLAKGNTLIYPTMYRPDIEEYLLNVCTLFYW